MALGWAGSGGALGACQSPVTPRQFCVAGMALGDIYRDFAWQARRLATCMDLGFAWQERHLETSTIINLRFACVALGDIDANTPTSTQTSFTQTSFIQNLEHSCLFSIRLNVILSRTNLNTHTHFHTQRFHTRNTHTHNSLTQT